MSGMKRIVGTIKQMNGLHLSDAIDALVSSGVPTEAEGAGEVETTSPFAVLDKAGRNALMWAVCMRNLDATKCFLGYARAGSFELDAQDNG